MRSRGKDDRNYIPGVNGRLLKMGAWCPYHKQSYRANQMVNGSISAVMCPRCVKDIEWARKAAEELRGDGAVVDQQTVLKRAELLAGHPLLRYANQPRGNA